MLMMDVYKKVIKTKIGNLVLCANAKGITKITVASNEQSTTENKWITLCEKQLQEYFEGKRKEFSIPLVLEGTDFQKSVWKELCNIPYGETRSYKDIAQEINNPKAMRAVGMANHLNPIIIIIPCHRVINESGKLGGYALGKELKQILLQHEKDTQ